GAAELLAEDDEAPLLRRAQRAHERQERRLPGARRPGEDNDLACRDRRRHVEEDLLPELPRAVVVRHGVHGDGRLGRHQNTSAGSAARSFRIAISADPHDMTSVSPSTWLARTGSIAIGSIVAWRATA